MYQSVTTPECTRGHGPMRVVNDQDGNPQTCYTIASPDLRRRFAFVAYCCPVCERLQFVDATLPLERRIDDVPTPSARRSTGGRYSRMKPASRVLRLFATATRAPAKGTPKKRRRWIPRSKWLRVTNDNGLRVDVILALDRLTHRYSPARAGGRGRPGLLPDCVHEPSGKRSTDQRRVLTGCCPSPDRASAVRQSRRRSG